MNDSLDLSWLTEIENHPSPTYFSKNQMQSIDVFFIYVNASNNIEKIKFETHPLVNSIFEKESLIKLIQTHRHPFPKTRYKLCDVLTFFIDIDPAELTEIDQYHDKWFKKIPIIDDINVPLSISLFHDINSIFIILQEMIAVQKPPLTNKPPVLPTSILKSNNHTNDVKKTKRVRISPDTPADHNKKTAKYREKDV
jgi:hypothetical protein